MVDSSASIERHGLIFSALADDTRRHLLSLLAEQPQSASALARQVDISRQAIAKHLSALELAALVRPERVGRELQFVVQPDSLDPALEWMNRTTQLWERRLDRLQARLDENESQRQSDR